MRSAHDVRQALLAAGRGRRSTPVTSSDPSGPFTGSPAASRRPLLLLALTVGAVLLSPLALRAVNRVMLPEVPSLGYLPALGLRRDHQPFRQETIEELRRGQPAWVFIGDSMLGTRIDPRRLQQLSTNGHEFVAFLYQAATGPGWWYLAFKNDLVASGTRPRCVFFFFRDTNLTDTLWRLAGHYGHALDTVATGAEPELDRLVAARMRGEWTSRAYSLLNGVYEADVAAGWMEPLVHGWFLRWRYPDAAERAAFEAETERAFGLEQLRSDVGSDLDVAANPDFARDLPTSVLPSILDLADQHGLRVCFVRVQRRPEGGHPPPQSPALAKYVADLAAYVESRGALFHDDTNDPELTEDLYGDGDHVRDRRRYTEIFRQRLAPLFQ